MTQVLFLCQGRSTARAFTFRASVVAALHKSACVCRPSLPHSHLMHFCYCPVIVACPVVACSPPSRIVLLALSPVFLSCCVACPVPQPLCHVVFLAASLSPSLPSVACPVLPVSSSVVYLVHLPPCPTLFAPPTLGCLPHPTPALYCFPSPLLHCGVCPDPHPRCVSCTIPLPCCVACPVPPARKKRYDMTSGRS